MVLDTQAGKKDILRPRENTPRFGEIFLDFEGDVQAPESTETPIVSKAKTVSILSSSYIIDSKYSIFGKKSAYFSGKRNQIHLGVNGSHFFSSHPEPFTITIPLLISEQGASSVVLDKTVFIRGKKFGFSLEIEENKLVFHARNLFQKIDGSTFSADIESPIPIPRKEWTFVSIFFDTIENRILLFQNGYQTAMFEATGEEIAGMGFPQGDTSNLILAKSYFGNIDGFHIHKGEPFQGHEYSRFGRVNYADDSKVATHHGSYVVSPVYSTNFSYSKLEKMQASFEKPVDTQFIVYFRGENKKFSEDEAMGPAWVRLDESFKSQNVQFKFKFHQWKVWLRSDPSGKTVPSFYGLRYAVKEQVPPAVPSNFRITDVNDKERSICFAWNSNHEREVQENGGYLIYFGVEANRMIGTLFVKAKDGTLLKIDGKEEGADYKNLKFCANENTLLANIYVPDKENSSLPNMLNDPKYVSRMERKGHLFQEGITYYFKISAYNHFFDEWEGRDQKSPTSSPKSFSFPKEISQR